jgi:hypothetical protein
MKRSAVAPRTLERSSRIGRKLVAMVATAAAAGTILVALLASPAFAFTLQGGTDAQRAVVNQTIHACALPYTTTDAELKFMGPVSIKFAAMNGISGYSEMGRIYINSGLTGKALQELTAHEWAHQIWYTLGPKWWAKWGSVCSGSNPSKLTVEWKDDPRENFAECAKVTLWNADLFVRQYPVTNLKVASPQVLRDWLTTARYVNKCPFVDLSPTAMATTVDQDELAAAGGYVADQGIMSGFSNTSFGASAPLTKRQLAQICQRASLSYPASWASDSGPATRGDVRNTIPGLSWTGERWTETITRGQIARLVWRSRS